MNDELDRAMKVLLAQIKDGIESGVAESLTRGVLNLQNAAVSRSNVPDAAKHDATT